MPTNREVFLCGLSLCGKSRSIYISMIKSIIEYCVGVWACCGEVNSGYLEALQKRAARVVVKTGSSSDAMASVMWPTLKERRTKHVYNLVNKSLARLYRV